jgi:hypothetical protein
MHLFQNAIAMDPQNVSTLVLLVAGVAWVGTLIVLLSDLFTDSSLRTVWKVIWFPVLICLPILGGFFYGAVALTRSLVGMRQSS